MNPITKIGLISSGITIMFFLAIYGAYTGIRNMLPSPSPTPVATTPPPSPSPTPDQVQSQEEASLPPQEEFTTFTDRYAAQLPANLSDEDLLHPDYLVPFIEQHKGQLIAEVTDEEITITAQEGRDAMQAYLDSVSVAHNEHLAHVRGEDIEHALAQAQEHNDIAAIQHLTEQIQHNIAIFKETPTPHEAVPFHKKLIGASQSLYNNLILTQNSSTDLIGALIGIKNIDDLNTVFTEIEEEMNHLREVHGIE